MTGSVKLSLHLSEDAGNRKRIFAEASLGTVGGKPGGQGGWKYCY